MEMLQIQLADNVKARYVNLKPNNRYKERNSKKEPLVRSQIAIYEYLKKHK